MTSEVDRLRRDSRWLAQLTLGLLVVTALALLLPTLIGRMMYALRDGDVPGLLQWSAVIWLPSLFYLYALWAIHSAFGAFAAGGIFGPAFANGCKKAGAALALGATTSAVIVPNLLRFLPPSPAIALGRGSLLHFDVAYLAVGVVGLALVLLGRLFGRAVEAQQEAFRLKNELDGFF